MKDILGRRMPALLSGSILFFFVVTTALLAVKAVNAGIKIVSPIQSVDSTNI